MDTKSGIKWEYNSIANTWRKKNWVNDKNFQNTIKDFSPFLSTDNLLDVGTGNGDFASLLGVKSVTGVDISWAMLEKGKELYPGFKFVKADAENLPFRDGTFRAVACRNLLQNFEDPITAFKEMLRVLKPGGKIFIVESAVLDEKDRIYPTKFCRLVEPFAPLFPSHKQLRKLFKTNHLKDIEYKVVRHHSKWLLNWLKSKGSKENLRESAYKILKNYPKWYKDKYAFKFHPKEGEVESFRTFCFIKATKSK